MWDFSGNSNLRLKIETLLNTGFASDLKIIVIQPNKIEEEIKAHKIFLKAGSSILNSIITQNCDQIVFENVEREIVKFMLKYLYTGTFYLGKRLLPALKLLQLATKYEIKGLIKKCEDALENWELKKDEALPLFEEAKLCHHNPTIERTIKYICGKAFIMLKRTDFTNLSQECMIEIIKQDELNLNEELEVFEAVYRWGEAECFRQSLDANDPATMRTILTKALPHVRFPIMENEDFVRKVCPTQLLSHVEVLELMTFMVSSTRSVGRFNATRRINSNDNLLIACILVFVVFIILWAIFLIMLKEFGILPER